MKTKSEAAIEYMHAKIKGLMIDEDLTSSDISLAFEQGFEFAQKWIPVEEELPEDYMDITRNELYGYTENVIYKTSNGKHGIAYRNEFLDHGFKWSGSGTLQKSITHWRPLN